MVMGSYLVRGVNLQFGDPVICIWCGDNGFAEIHKPASQADDSDRRKGDYQFARLDSHAECFEYI